MNRSIKIFCLMTFLLSSQLGFAQRNTYELLEIAGQNNPAIKAQYERYQSALQRIDQKASLPDPTLSFGYFISPVETRVGPQQFKLSVSQMFPWIGTNNRKANVATAQAKVEFEKFIALKNKLFLEVRMAYAELYLLRKEIVFKKKEIEILKSFEPTVRTKYESNLVSLTDLIRVEISIENANAALHILSKKETALLSQINTLLNRETGSQIQELELESFEENDLHVLDSALINNPELNRARSEVAASEEMILLSEMIDRPSFGIGLDYAFVGKRDDINVPDNGRDILMPMFTISLPIFGKKSRAVKEEARLMKTSADHLLESEIDQLTNRWNQNEFQKERVALLEQQMRQELTQTELMLNVLMSEYTNRNTNFEELLSTQKRLIQLEVELERLYVARYKTYANKEYLAGSTTDNLKSYENE